jgi:hypothetical protein
MCGRVPLSSDVSEIRLVFGIPPERAAAEFSAQLEARVGNVRNDDSSLIEPVAVA